MNNLTLVLKKCYNDIMLISKGTALSNAFWFTTAILSIMLLCSIPVIVMLAIFIGIPLALWKLCIFLLPVEYINEISDFDYSMLLAFCIVIMIIRAILSRKEK